jgi:hypothetical protein
MKVLNNAKMGGVIESIKNRMGIGTPERNAADAYERGMAIVPDCIKANENEIPVRQYNVAILRSLLKFERAEGRMQVTNKRVVFRAAGRSVGGRTALQHEYAIDEIAGIETRSNYKFSLLYLIFAILIAAAASFLIHGPDAAGIITSMGTPSARISGIMSPNHVQKAYSNAGTAISQTKNAEEKLIKSAEQTELAKAAEEKAAIRTESYRDRSAKGLQEAQGILEAATAKRKIAGKEEQNTIAEIETAKGNEEKAIKSMDATVTAWKVLMSILGLILGVGGLISFFMLNKKFALKLFLLNFSVFGFALSFAASGISIFMLFSIVPVITTLVCIFIFCFRPNLVISIKNKMGSGAGPIDIRSGSNSGFAEVFPTEETEGAIREIGAMIGDIQKLGDLGIEKWVKR